VLLLGVLIGISLVALAVMAFGPDVRRWNAKRRAGIAEGRRRRPRFDPGRERRAEVKARELLRSVIGPEAYAMYRELGFLRVPGKAGADYAYLIYPHRPVIAYDESTGNLLNEYCVGFPDGSDAALGERLPDSDDVLAKWMALHGDERRLIGDSNMHLPGRQVDPGQVRRDLRRLRLWEGRRRTALAAH
jgi:hypothetical protein